MCQQSWQTHQRTVRPNNVLDETMSTWTMFRTIISPQCPVVCAFEVLSASAWDPHWKSLPLHYFVSLPSLCTTTWVVSGYHGNLSARQKYMKSSWDAGHIILQKDPLLVTSQLRSILLGWASLETVHLSSCNYTIYVHFYVCLHVRSVYSCCLPHLCDYSAYQISAWWVVPVPFRDSRTETHVDPACGGTVG